MQELVVETHKRTEFVNIDEAVQGAIEASGVRDGVCEVFVPHTTAGITINENADPDVLADLEMALERAVPWSAGYAHGEGNAAAHVKASMMGADARVFVTNGRIAFGTWQSLFFCEFDGPRSRTVWVHVTGG